MSARPTKLLSKNIKMLSMVGLRGNGVRAIIAFLLPVLIITLLSSMGMGLNSPSGNFSALPVNVSFNWTNDTISLTSNINYSYLWIENETTSITPEYFITAQYPNQAGGGYLSSDEWDVCFSNGAGFLIQNQTSSYTNRTGFLNDTNSSAFYINPQMFCPAGLYTGNFTVYDNTSNSTENISVKAMINVPLNTNNTLNQTSKYGYMNGRMLLAQATADTYHSYYLNTSEIGNATSVTIILSGMSQNMDLFLFNSTGDLQAQSINTSTNPDEVTVSLPSVSDMWELRVFGDVTSSLNFNAYLYYNTLNFTNDAGGEPVSSVNLGILNSTGTGNENFTVRNVHYWNLTGVNQTVEVYNVETLTDQSAAKTFHFLVPSYAQKVRADVQWSIIAGNVSDWDLYLRDANDNLLGSSTSKYLNTNITNATREEYIEYTGPFNLTNEGYWNVTVLNNSYFATQINYTLRFYVWVNSSEWISTNFTQNTSFREPSNANASAPVNVSITVPQDRILNGTYGGFLQYDNNDNWKARLPLSFKVTTGNLLVNDAYGNTSTYRVKRNLGMNDTFFLNISYNNTGANPIYYTNNTSSNTLYSLSNVNRTINFTVVTWPGEPIGGGTSGTIDLNVSIRTNETANLEGIYRGWVFFNTTNTDQSNSSHPYKTFNLTVEVNLTDQLDVIVIGFTPSAVNVTGNASNITIEFNVSLENGTLVSGSTGWGAGNFTNFKIKENNVPTHIVSLTNKNTSVGGGNWCGFGGNCRVNATVPLNTVGGYYNTTFTVQWNTGESTLAGQAKMVPGVNLTVQDRGLSLTSKSDETPSVYEGVYDVYFNVSVKNYGPWTATGTLNMTGSCSYATVAVDNRGSGCGSQSGRVFTMAIDGNGSETCWYRWKLTSEADIGNVSYRTCNFDVLTSESSFNDIDVTLTILNKTGGTSDDTTDGTTTATGDDTTDDDDDDEFAYSLSITDYPTTLRAVLGGGNVTNITVKNTGDLSVSVKSSVTIGDGITASVTPTTQPIISGGSKDFTITFNVSNSTALGDHSGTFKTYMSLMGETDDTKTFTLTVTPTQEKIGEISDSYQNYSGAFDVLFQNFTAIKESGLVAEENVSRVEVLINDTMDTLQSIKNAMDSGDYATAESLLADMNATLNNIKSRLETLATERQTAADIASSGLWTWIIIGVIIAAAAGLFAYMLLPPGGYSMSQRFGPKPLPLKQRVANFPRNAKKKIADLFRRLFRRKKEDKAKVESKKYASGYEKQRPGGYKFGKKK